MSDTTSSEHYLWRLLAEFVARACALFGDPAALARTLWLTRARHAQICAWLRPLEALSRRLLFLKARRLTLEIKPTREAKRRPRLGMPIACGAAFDSDNSASWRVRFNPALASPHPHTPTHTAQAPQLLQAPQSAPQISAAPVAMRLEALLRVLADPTPHVENLARALARASTPPFAWLVVPRRCTGPLYTPAREASMLICGAIGAPAHADSS